jgi:hypothetical protein
MRGSLPPLHAADHSSLFAYDGRAWHARPRLMCDSGRAGARGKESEKLPRSSRRRLRLDPRTPSSEIIAPPPVATLHLSIGFPLPSGQEGEHHSHKWLPYAAPPVAFVMSRSAASCFRHRDPTSTISDMSRGAFNQTVHHLGTGKTPCLDGIPNEIVKYLPQKSIPPYSPLRPYSLKTPTPHESSAKAPHAYSMKRGPHPYR